MNIGRIKESARALFTYAIFMLGAFIGLAVTYWPITFVIVTVLFVTKCSL